MLGNTCKFVNRAQWHANTIYEWFTSEQNDTFCKLEVIKNDKFCNVTRSKEWSFLGIETIQEQIYFWKWERAVLMFGMYIRVYH